MDLVLRVAKSLHFTKWRTLRIKVTSAKKDAQKELEELSQDSTEWDTIPEYMTRVHTLDNVLTWMDQIEEVLDE